MRNTLCCIFNYAPHYRQAIYKLMDKELKCNFFFGDNVRVSIKKLNYDIFKQPVKELWTVWYFNRIYKIRGVVKLIFKPYKAYLVTGETHCLSMWIMLLLSVLTGKKIYVWTHGFYGNENVGEILLRKLLVSMAAGIFLYGNHARNLMIQHGIKPDKLYVIFNSLYYDEMLEVRKDLGVSDIYKRKFNNSNPVLIFIGRLTKVKKLDMLITVLKELHIENKLLNLVIIGDGNERKNLECLVEELNLESSVWFYGPCYDHKITGQLIYNADVCVSPGNVGLTAIHSLSFGTPVITNDNFAYQMPEFEAVIPGLTGEFFKYDSLVDLRKKIVTWINLEPEHRQNVRLSSYRIIDEFYNPHYQIRLLKEVSQKF